MGNEGPLLTCMLVEVVGTVDCALLGVPGRLATVNVGFSESCWTEEEEEAVHMFFLLLPSHFTAAVYCATYILH